MLRLAAERDSLRVVDDQIGCPTYAPDIAAAIFAVARRALGEGWQAKYGGVTHMAGPDAVTWFKFAELIVAGAALRGGRSVPVSPISTAEYPTPAVRPANSHLSSAKLASVFDLRLPPLSNSLASCLDRLLKT
jgi:dTDP-4-dehydrorhamnose reductase